MSMCVVVGLSADTHVHPCGGEFTRTNFINLLILCLLLLFLKLVFNSEISEVGDAGQNLLGQDSCLHVFSDLETMQQTSARRSYEDPYMG